MGDEHSQAACGAWISDCLGHWIVQSGRLAHLPAAFHEPAAWDSRLPSTSSADCLLQLTTACFPPSANDFPDSTGPGYGSCFLSPSRPILRRKSLRSARESRDSGMAVESFSLPLLFSRLFLLKMGNDRKLTTSSSGQKGNVFLRAGLQADTGSHRGE